MNTVDICIQGLSLWLTAWPMIAVVPDFHSAQPAHNAELTVAKVHLPGRGCPKDDLFEDRGTVCVARLNGAGRAGGVWIDVIGDIPETPDAASLAAIPRIQHGPPLRMRREYEPKDGSRLAAKMIVTRGTLVPYEEPCPKACPKCPCPRSVRWTLTASEGGLSLLLSNLTDGRSVLVPLENGAKVTVSNHPPNVPTPTTTRDTAHWCLYFTMFEEAGCPGNPDPPAVPAPGPGCTATSHAHGKPPNIETIACSNSQYP